MADELLCVEREERYASFKFQLLELLLEYDVLYYFTHNMKIIFWNTLPCIILKKSDLYLQNRSSFGATQARAGHSVWLAPSNIEECERGNSVVF